MNYGAGVLGLAMLQSEQDERYRQEAGERQDRIRAQNEFEKYVFAAKSHVHGLRARLYAREMTENELIAALKAENANHPLSSKEAVEAAVYDKEVAALINPEVIKRTYPDGKLPEGAVIPPDKVNTIA